MKRANFNKRLLLGTLGVGTISLWSKAFIPDPLKFESLNIGGPKEHVRHGTLDLFASDGIALDEDASIKIDRHIFFKNGFSASSLDMHFVHIEYASTNYSKSVLLHIEDNKVKVSGSDDHVGSKNSPTTLLSDDPLRIHRLNDGRIKLEKGDIILSLKGAVRINGYLLSNDEAIYMKSKAQVNCASENAIPLLIRSMI